MNKGWNVAGCGRSSEPDEAFESKSYLYKEVDISDHAAQQAFLAEVKELFGSPDVWVNNAGVLEPIGMGRNLDPAAVAKIVSTNILGVMYGTQLFLAELHQMGRQGTVVNISSGAAHSVYQGWSAYGASKAAVDHYSCIVADEEQVFGNRVFSLAPGVVESRMHEIIRSQKPEDFPLVEKFRDLHQGDMMMSPDLTSEAIFKLATFELPKDLDSVLDVRTIDFYSKF